MRTITNTLTSAFNPAGDANEKHNLFVTVAQKLGLDPLAASDLYNKIPSPSEMFTENAYFITVAESLGIHPVIAQSLLDTFKTHIDNVLNGPAAATTATIGHAPA